MYFISTFYKSERFLNLIPSIQALQSIDPMHKND